MTLATTVNKVIYSGNGVTTTFPFSFPVPNLASLFVIYTDATGAETTLNSSQYTVSGLGNPNGGSVTYAPAILAGTKLTIKRVVPLTQTTELVNQGGFYPDEIEARFDYQTEIDQQLQEQLNRALVIPSSSAASPLLPPPAAGQSFMWNSSGNGLVNFNPSTMMAQATLSTATIVTNVAGLRGAVGASDGTYARTQGYYNAGDGGGLGYYWSAASTATDDGASVIKPTSVSGAGRWLAIFEQAVRLEACGGDPTGVADSTTALLNAMKIATTLNTFKVVGNGKFKLNPQAWPYVSNDAGAGGVYKTLVGVSQQMDLEFHGELQLTSNFDFAGGWTFGGSGDGSSQFCTGGLLKITGGDIRIFNYSARLYSFALVNQQLYLAGHGVGQDALVSMGHVSSVNQSGDARPGLRIDNKYWIDITQRCEFGTYVDNTTETDAVLWNISFEAGLTSFSDCIITFGKLHLVVTGTPTAFGFDFRNVTSEGLRGASTLSFIKADLPSGEANAVGNMILENVSLADPSNVAAVTLNVTGGSLNSVRFLGTIPTYLGNINYCYSSADYISFDYELLRLDGNNIRVNHSHDLGGCSTVDPLSNNASHATASVVNDVTLLAAGAIWASPTGTETAPDGVANGAQYIDNTAGGSTLFKSTSTPATTPAVGDYYVFGCWLKNEQQASVIIPTIQLSWISNHATFSISGTSQSAVQASNHQAFRIKNTKWGFFYIVAKIATADGSADAIEAFTGVPVGQRIAMYNSFIARIPATANWSYLDVKNWVVSNRGFGGIIAAGSKWVGPRIEYLTATVIRGVGAGTPEGAVTGGIGSTWQRTDGGAATSFYVKESGTGNTGWVGK